MRIVSLPGPLLGYPLMTDRAEIDVLTAPKPRPGDHADRNHDADAQHDRHGIHERTSIPAGTAAVWFMDMEARLSRGL
jgi:hypothetical protein